MLEQISKLDTLVVQLMAEANHEWCAAFVLSDGAGEILMEAVVESTSACCDLVIMILIRHLSALGNEIDYL